MMSSIRQGFVLALGATAIVFFTMAFRVRPAPDARRVYVTLGELQAIHATVRIAGNEVRGVQRFSAGERITTNDRGRARARLDDGTSLVLDRGIDLRATEAGVTLDAGRLFVQGGVGAHSEIVVGEVTILVGASTVAIDRTDATRFYCVAGELIARAFGKETRVRSGEMAQASEKELVVASAKVWNDWTGGMARPWSVSGKPRGAVGELWGKLSGVPDDVGTQLATRGHDVTVTIAGEVATTETRTTYFNAGSAVVVGDFRMALPAGAIVSGYAVGTPDALVPASLRIATDTQGDTEAPRLEWAGEGWVRGTTRPIRPATSAVVVVRYVEWLSPAGGRMTYRYPMRGEGPPPVIGELHARIDIGPVDAVAVGVGEGMLVQGDAIEMRRADFRPTADLVVEFQLRPGAFSRARAYIVPGLEDTAASYLLVRSEVTPAGPSHGTTLALLVDTSRSIDPSLLEVERSVVLSLLEGLGPDDRVVVLAADASARPVGPETLGPADEARKAKIRRGLGELRSGGATDLGAALERAAEALPSDDPSATLLYIGDGWPTEGDRDVEAIRARLSRQKSGLPRLGAVAVGPFANRSGLSALVHGGGPVYSVDSTPSAAEVAVHLLADALQPSVTGVDLDFGSDVERVYPRGVRTVRSGDTLTTVGRLKGLAPRTMDLTYRDAAGERKERLPVATLPVVDDGDVRRRWGAARVLELMLRGGGREGVVDAALQNELLTPWTGWAVGVSSGESYRATPLWARVLDSALDGNLAVFSAAFVTPRPPVGALRAPSDEPWPRPDSPGEHDAWKLAAEAAARRTLDEALGSVRMCRESRAALRPEVGGALRVQLSLDGDGRVRDVTVKAATAVDDDAAVDRCVEQVIRSAVFYATGGGVAVLVTYEFHLPPARDGRARACSKTSSLPAPARRAVWFERLHRAESDLNPIGLRGEWAYLRAKGTCELPTWTDRRAFLELLLSRAQTGTARVELARLLEEGGDTDAADLVRREAVRRAESPAELDAIRRALLANEPDVSLPFVTAYAKTSGNEARLAVVQRFLHLAPHDSRLRRKELTLLEALGRKDDLAAEVGVIRQEPFLDALLLADAASALRLIGAEDEARRTFGELAERAPEVPFARALLGDRLFDEGLYDEATTAYDALLRLVPDDPGASFRLALANAGAGRLDVALRMLTRVTETGGRTSDAILEDLASMTAAMLLAESRAGHPAAEEEARLRRRALETPEAAGIVLVRVPTWVAGVKIAVLRGKAGDDAEGLPVVHAPSLGLAGLRLERGEGAFRVRVSRQADLEPSRPATARIELLLPDDKTGTPTWIRKEVPLRVDGQDSVVVWDGGSFS